MIRYNLDALGWYQFEWLVQSLLKSEIGLAVESWGQRGDHGRDAYAEGQLHFPERDILSDGPFVFQVKFVEGANSAGADPATPLRNAIRKEATRIAARSRQVFPVPRHYALITNAQLTTTLRDEIDVILGGVLPGAHLHKYGGNDVCDLLDGQPALRRSFPQLLSLRDLDALLLAVVNKEVLERSASALHSALDHLNAFVPTSAYGKTWSVLRKHCFAVLEGPPEMGKTAIAWVIAVAQLSMGWQAVVCDGPDDFFRCYDPAAEQVFIADDAFGRTEYDPSRGSKWEIQLDRVLGRLDSSHWLLWTSRKHILERACKVMDLQGKARTFPQPGAVLIDAGKLNLREKALVLYRHARAANLEHEAKSLLREKARTLVSDPSFTPERIRQFVADRLPQLTSDLSKGTLSPETLEAEVREAVRNPTERTRKAFRHLPVAHKWLLVSLLEAGERPSSSALKALYEKHCPLEERRAFHEVFDELTEAFIKAVAGGLLIADWIEWMHPSYRDLVIEELLRDRALLVNFLKTMAWQGVKLAISDSGGARGERVFPLLPDPETWALLDERCIQLAGTENSIRILDILRSLTSAVRQTKNKTYSDGLRRVIGRMCDITCRRWNEEGEALWWYVLKTYCEASVMVRPLPPIPDLTNSWKVAHEDALAEIEKAEGGQSLDPTPLRDWAKMAEVINEYEPRFLKQAGFPEGFKEQIHSLINCAKSQVGWEIDEGSQSEMIEEAERLESIATAVDAIGELSVPHTVPSEEVEAELNDRAERLRERAGELEPPTRDDDDTPPDEDYRFDVEGLFADL